MELGGGQFSFRISDHHRVVKPLWGKEEEFRTQTKKHPLKYCTIRIKYTKNFNETERWTRNVL